MAEFDISKQLSIVLTEYNDSVLKSIDAAAEKCAKGLRKDLKQTSPKRTGAYGKSWSVKSENESFTGSKAQTVHNRKHYQLTHLLEYGHGGPHPAPAYPHIASAEKKWTKEFERLCEEACEG